MQNPSQLAAEEENLFRFDKVDDLSFSCVSNSKGKILCL